MNRGLWPAVLISAVKPCNGIEEKVLIASGDLFIDGFIQDRTRGDPNDVRLPVLYRFRNSDCQSKGTQLEIVKQMSRQ